MVQTPTVCFILIVLMREKADFNHVNIGGSPPQNVTQKVAGLVYPILLI